MSDKKKVTKVTENEKVMTKYDLKMQKRKEQAAKDKIEEIKGIVIGVVLLVALAAFVISFPIRNWSAVNGTYIKVNGEKITPVEYEFQYNNSKNNYLSMYGSFLGMMGITDLTTIESQVYEGNLTYKDMFDQMAVSNIASNKGLLAKAKAGGFTYDAAADLEKAKAEIESLAAEEGITFDQYLMNYYGSLATWERITPYMEEQFYVAAYYNKVSEDMAPSEDEIQAEYEANQKNYDVVDYYMTTVKAELPTTAPDGTVEKDENGNDIPYEPTEEEIAAAMKEAKKEAEKLEKNIFEEGTEYIGKKYATVNSNIADFLFDESRKQGDTAVIEASVGNRYLVVGFNNRYRSEEPTYDYRMIYSTTTETAAMLEEWEAGGSTEEAFIELVAKYDENNAGAAGGLYTGMASSYYGEDLEAWLTEEGRAAGDTFAQDNEAAHTLYYFIGQNEPEWRLSCEGTLTTNAMAEFMTEATQQVEIKDPKKNLDYLYKEVETEESAETTDEAAAQ